MGTIYGPTYTRIADIKGPSGFYRVTLGRDQIQVYVNQDYDGGGWVCVLANRKNTAGMNNLTYYDAVNNYNYRTGGTANGTNTTVDATQKLAALSNYNIWIGLKYWSSLAGRVVSNKITVVQFVATTDGTALNGTHTKRYRWRFDSFTSTYAPTTATAVSDETGTGAPGYYNYHAANGFNLTTYDLDQDTYGTNCSALYNNNPWWYGNCWSGNYFAGGGGYADAPYWDGSGADNHQYGAVYIK